MEEKDEGSPRRAEVSPQPKANSTTQSPSNSKTLLYPQRHDDSYESRKYFVTRPGAFDQAMEDLKTHLAANKGEVAHSFWLLTEIDHWNIEKERIVVLTDAALPVCKYDFIMLKCLELQRIPLTYIEKISTGPFAFPEKSLDRRNGEGLRIFWDKQQEPNFVSRWNPWSTDMPYTTFTEHPVKNGCPRLSPICQVSAFQAQLLQAVQSAQEMSPAPGRIPGVVLVSEPIRIQTYTGMMAFFGNQNKLGYCLARGSIGF
ncbi:tumor protein p63-regulated gene 1 protein [Pantherophis guttatus]|uniref:Tumor protein p63-regulated gene 1 protein n=1 Tax=Pantherophis guttatus TaxID=94885 RepID=A0ABM3ZPW3_PANGU|nr:tumor protein p63-regulated gene 1 protein [Pantherophis guttatus]